MQECLQHHSSCANPLDEFMPTRILEISSSGSSIHIRKDASPAPYAVLSYCWGGPQEITLTKSQVRLSQLSFSTATLPQTFQDAVLVCRELGLKYLWVDALCIVQDDSEDKAIEIGKMASIYQNSGSAIGDWICQKRILALSQMRFLLKSKFLLLVKKDSCSQPQTRLMNDTVLYQLRVV